MNAKLKTFLRSTVVTIVLVVVAVGAAGMWYMLAYSMKPAVELEINDPKLDTRILIATQGSKFKDSVVARVIDKLKGRPIYVKVVDVKELRNVEPSAWTAIVIIHTWEAGAAPKSVSEFVKRVNAADLIILATSGDGGNHIKGVDGITSSSKPAEIDRCVRAIMDRIEIKIAPGEISIESNH